MLNPPIVYSVGVPMPAEPNAMTAGETKRMDAISATVNAKNFIFT